MDVRFWGTRGSLAKPGPTTLRYGGDHIQGFPFFAPLFIPGNTWDIYAPGTLGQQLEQTLAGQMEYKYFPVTLAQLGATIRFHDLAGARSPRERYASPRGI